jgi:gliding motility-associated-like protein
MKRFLLVIGIVTILFFSFQNTAAQSNQTVTNGAPTAAVDLSETGCTYNWVNNTPAIGLATSGKGNIASFTAINNGNSPVTATITATPVAAGFAYIAHGDSDIAVINTVTNILVSTIKVGSFPYSISVSPDGSLAYVTNFGSGTVSVISTATNSVINTINAGAAPFMIAVSPDGSRVYVTNYGGTLTVISTVSNKIITTIQVGNKPFGVVVGPDNRTVYVTNQGSNSISVINAANFNASTIMVGNGPYNAAISPDGNTLYVTNSNSGSVSAINTTTYAAATITVGQGPSGICVNPDGSYVYVVNQISNTVSIINTENNSVMSTIPVGMDPWGISVTPDGTQIYVANQFSMDVSVINTAENAVAVTIPLGSSAISMGNFITGKGCNSAPVTFTITVNPTQALPSPVITTGAVNGNISACEGTASINPNIQQFMISGNNLTNNIIATAPTDFEISLNMDNGYSNNITINPSDGAVSNTVVYVRSAASASSGPISGNVTLTSTGAANQNVAITGIVNALPVVDAVPDQIVSNGGIVAAINFEGTADTFNWVNDTPGIGLAASGTGNIASFIAINNSSIPVTATITVTPFTVENKDVITPLGPETSGCNGKPVAFNITLNPSSSSASIAVPNSFTPNNDGVNDTWNIKNINLYPKNAVKVYNRYGEKVYSSIGYGVPWDGRYGGKDLPTGTYYYIIDLKNGNKVLSGDVTIIR